MRILYERDILIAMELFASNSEGFKQAMQWVDEVDVRKLKEVRELEKQVIELKRKIKGIENEYRWISVRKELPKVGDRVEVLISRRSEHDRRVREKIETFAVYEDGTELVSDCSFAISRDCIVDSHADIDTNSGQFKIPAGWYEVPIGHNSNYFCKLDNQDKVTHWRKVKNTRGERQ